MEGRSFLRIVGKHIVEKIFPIGMKLPLELDSSLPDLIFMPFISQIFKGLYKLHLTLTVENRHY